MPQFVVEFLTRYGLNAGDLVTTAGFVVVAVQWLKQYIPAISGYWTVLATAVVSLGVSFMAYELGGVQSILIATAATTIIAVVGKGTINQFVPEKSIKAKRLNGGGQ